MINHGNSDSGKNQRGNRQRMQNSHFRSKSGKAAVGAWVGGTAVGVALTGAFVAGHVYWPAQNGANSGSADVLPAKLQPAAGMAIGENTIADIAETANKSVVNIDTRSSITISDSPFFGIPFGGPMDFFFGQGNGEGMQMPRKMESKGVGSGLIFRQDGYILTNNHVIGNVQSIKVTLADKRVFDGKVVGRDKFTDLAIVKINATDLPAAKLGSSKNLRPGDWVIAIGSAMGLDHTVTLGIISALNRSVNEINQVQLIQTDAAINHGNSGGPLLNIHGEVIGIDEAIRPDAQNIGFAIPIDVAKDIAAQLVEHGNIARAYVGIYMQTLEPKIAKALGVPENVKGVLISRTAPGGPGAKAGLAQGDVVQKVDKQDVTTGTDIQEIVRKHKPGDTINFLVMRQNQLVPVDVKVGELQQDDNN
jgi:serine protease Do